MEQASTFIRTTLRHPDFISGWKKLIDLGLTQDQPVFSAPVQSPSKIVLQFLAASNQQEQYQKWLKEDPLFEKQIVSLGLQGNSFNMNKPTYSPASLLQELLEQNLGMNENDQDRVIMQHEFIYNIGKENYSLTSSLVLDGDNAVDTAMAKTVGLPLALAATFFLENKIQLVGLHRPLSSVFYSQILPALEKEGISFKEKECRTGEV
jgi:saccharopine dehydrogenase (NADP+, L-glutamate forming)